MAVVPNLKPFPQLQGVTSLSWDDCFGYTQEKIRANFIEKIANNANHTTDNSTRKLATLLLSMVEAMMDKDRV